MSPFKLIFQVRKMQFAKIFFSIKLNLEIEICKKSILRFSFFNFLQTKQYAGLKNAIYNFCVLLFAFSFKRSKSQKKDAIFILQNDFSFSVNAAKTWKYQKGHPWLNHIPRKRCRDFPLPNFDRSSSHSIIRQTELWPHLKQFYFSVRPNYNHIWMRL